MNNLYKNAIDKIMSASFTGDDGLDYVETLVALDALKSVEKNHGEWIFFLGTGYGNPYGHFECSLCGDGYGYKTDFCPSCGADMRSEQDD